MNSYKHLKNVLNYNLNKIVEFFTIFCENPEKDFTRDRKLNFKTTMRNVICMETGSLKDELLKINDFSIEIPTTSAFVQARCKIKVDAFCQLVDRYNGFEHIVKSENKYLIRVQDINLKISITRSLAPFPDDEFDIGVFRILTLKHDKILSTSL